MILETVKTLCEEKKINISTLEKKAGIANGTIRGWDKSSPRIVTLEKVAKVLDCSINELVSK